MGNTSFLQSSQWAKFQESLGRKVWLLKDDFAQILVIKHNLPFNKIYLYSPRADIRYYLPASSSALPDTAFGLIEGGREARRAGTLNDRFENFKKFLEKIKKIAEKEGAVFFKIEPEIEDNPNFKRFLETFGFGKSQKEIQPKTTLILDITKSEEEILKEMHPKARYNIRVAQRHKLEITNLKSQIPDSQFQIRNYFERFWELLKQTTKRDKFFPHSKEYYQKMLDLPFVEIFLAKYKNKIIAANILVFFGERAIYLYGASDYNFRRLMPPYLLHWEQIKEAKTRGFREYDFWGINEKKWPGLTRFKKGFGGKEINYLGSYDLLFQPLWYKLYSLARKFK